MAQGLRVRAALVRRIGIGLMAVGVAVGCQGTDKKPLTNPLPPTLPPPNVQRPAANPVAQRPAAQPTLTADRTPAGVPTNFDRSGLALGTGTTPALPPSGAGMSGASGNPALAPSPVIPRNPSTLTPTPAAPAAPSFVTPPADLKPVVGPTPKPPIVSPMPPEPPGPPGGAAVVPDVKPPTVLPPSVTADPPMPPSGPPTVTIPPPTMPGGGQ